MIEIQQGRKEKVFPVSLFPLFGVSERVGVGADDREAGLLSQEMASRN